MLFFFLHPNTLMKIIPETRRGQYIYIYIYVFIFHHWIDTSGGGLLVPEGIIYKRLKWFVKQPPSTQNKVIKYFVE